MKKLIIFDLDGTLVNSLYDLADSVNYVLESHNLPVHDTDCYRYFVGDGTIKLIERALPEAMRDRKTITEYHAEFSAEYNKRVISKTRPYENIIDTVKAIKEKGCIVAVASNKPDNFAKYIVNALFKENFFDFVAGKKDGVPTKPAPDIVYAIVKDAQTDIKSAVMVGDSDVDVMTAHNAGVKCIGCSWGFRGKKELENAGADYIADKPFDILDFI